MNFDRTLLSVAVVTLSAIVAPVAIYQPEEHETQKDDLAITMAGTFEIQEEYENPDLPICWEVRLPRERESAITDLYVDFDADPTWVEPLELAVEIRGETQWRQLLPRERSFHLTFPAPVSVRAGESLTIQLHGERHNLPLRLLVRGRHIE